MVLRVKIIVLVASYFLFLFSLQGCEKPYDHQIEKEAVDDGIQKESDWLKKIFSYEKEDVSNALNRLVSIRYYSSISGEQIAVLRDAWKMTSIQEYGWSEEVLKEIQVRIILAEILSKYDAANAEEYHRYILAELSNSNPGDRATAALSLGFVGLRKDVDVLLDMLLNDHELPAIQAGFGLIAMDDPYAYEMLDDALEKLAKNDSPRDRRVYHILKEHLEHVRE